MSNLYLESDFFDSKLQFFPAEFNGTLIWHFGIMIKEWAVIYPNSTFLQNSKNSFEVSQNIVGSIDKETSHDGVPTF